MKFNEQLIQEVKQYLNHLPYCNTQQDWLPAQQALADSPEGEDKYKAQEEINYLRNVCTCGLEKLLEDLEKKEEDVVKPKVVCFCGSTRFASYFMISRWEYEKRGIITFGINILPDNYFAEGNSHGAEQEGVKEILDELHKRKIDLSDEVFVLNVGGYIGESTSHEIEYAISKGKPVKYFQ